MDAHRHLPGPRVYISFDGPLADFDKAAHAAGMPPNQFERVAGAYLNLPLTEGALEAIEELVAAGLPVFGLTNVPRSNPYAATEKLLWADVAVPRLSNRVVIAADEGAVGAPQDYLVVGPSELASAERFPGTLLRFADNWPELVQRLTGDLNSK